MKIKIWERYLLKEFFKVFVLFLGCFYGLYVIIDYASHTSALPLHSIQIKGFEFFRYYTFVFVSRAEIIIPLALIIAVIKTLTSLNLRGELVGFLASGFKIKTLVRPFIVIGCLGVLLMYVNEQFLLPDALKQLRYLEGTTKHQKKFGDRIVVRNLLLEDGSIFLFQSFDSEKKQFFDAYWIRSPDELYRIKYLSPDETPPRGYFVDHLKRRPDGEIALVDSFPSYSLTGLTFNSTLLQSALSDSDTLNFNELLEKLPSPFGETGERESNILTSFYWKMIVPWLCLLAIIAPIPSCIAFSRNFPLFFIYVCGIFGIIAFYLFLDAASIASKRQVLPSFGILVLPFLCISGLFLRRFAKIR